jgi:SecD/SecF fusion protein
MQNTRAHFIALVIVLAVCLFVVLPIPNKPKVPILGDAKIQLGIDLQGGAELRYRALFAPGETKKDQIMQQIVQVLHNRINKRGLKEPKIAPVGEDMVTLQLAGIDKDALEDYRRLIQGVGKLELRVAADPDIHDEFNKTGRYPSDQYEPVVHAQARVDTIHNIKERVLLRRTPVITGADVSDARSELNYKEGGATFHVVFELHPNGAKQFDDAALELYHRPDKKSGWPKGLIAILLDGKVEAMPQVIAEKFDGHGTITGGYDQKGAQELAIILKSGSLPVPIGKRTVVRDGEKERIVDEPKVPEAQNFVGPSLGQDSIARGMIASVLSVILVAAFMAVYYRAGGLVSVFGLVFNMILLLGLMALLNATLTLPGIAGIVLTIGMAVDANILIYERVREEMARGKTAIQAYEAGHDRAFVTIIDANLTTFAAAIVLYYVGTGAIQGFAITLIVGIITTLISVLWGCKVVLRMLVFGGKITQWRMGQAFKKEPSYDFVRLLKPMVTVSAIAMIGSVAVFWARGASQLGIEFTGGTMLTYSFSQDTGIDDVRQRVTTIKGADGLPLYPDAEIQTMAPPTASGAPKLIAGSQARDFQMRTKAQNAEEIRTRLIEAFSAASGWKGPALSPGSFLDVAPADVPENDRWSAPKISDLSGAPGGGLWVHFVEPPGTPFDLAALTRTLQERFKKANELRITRDTNDEPIFGGPDGAHQLVKDPASPPGLARVRLLFLKHDVQDPAADLLRNVRENLKKGAVEGAFALAQDPFTSVQNIGPAVATEMYHSTFWAMIIAWILMIIYVAFRFQHVTFGVAAVVALVHDALLAIGFTSLAGLVVPKSWGLSFEMNMATVAAILTIIGFSINDTIVTFDRIRENLILMKKNTFAEIVNTSVNQTLGRTILTAFTVWVTCIVLYAFTMTSAGGIASFSFPMLIGVIVGSYSTIYIAAPVLLLWYRGGKPAIS